MGRSVLTISSMKVVNGKKLASARMRQHRWNSGRKKVIRELSCEAQAVSSLSSLSRTLQQFAQLKGTSNAASIDNA